MMYSKNDLDITELLLLNSELRDREKSLAIAYLMLIGGHLGIHRFYLKRYASGTGQIVLTALTVFFYILGLASSVFSEGLSIFLFLLCVLSAFAIFVWIIVDLFLVPGMVREWNAQLEQQLLHQIITQRSARQQSNHPL